MRNTARQQIGSLLGLFAILLTVFAPLVSQALRAGQPFDFSAAAICSVHEAPLSSPAPGKDAPASAPDGQPCAYCAFSLHAPPLPSAVQPLVAAVPPADVPATAAVHAWPHAPRAAHAQSRAPPSLLS